jgi:site-specific DNA-methyltransferase (adenine-specific)
MAAPITVQPLTKPTTPEACLWNGWKSHGLKPAYEPILVAMKPNDGSYAENALKWGVAGLNIDGGRIEAAQGEYDIRHYTKEDCFQNKQPKKSKFQVKPQNPQGRFPANVILDEQAAEMLDEQSGASKPKQARTARKGGCAGALGEFGGSSADAIGHWPAEQGGQGASRFFYVAKASKAERNAGCEGLEERQYSYDGRNKPIENAYQRNKSKATNNHPTVKPLALMQYLVRLTKTPTGGVVLDPFCGSGTTCMACILEDRNYIGIEREPEYIEIAEKRIAWSKEQKGLF